MQEFIVSTGTMHIHMTIANMEMMMAKVVDNKMPQQMAFHGVACCLHRCQIVIRLWYVRQYTNMPQA